MPYIVVPRTHNYIRTCRMLHRSTAIIVILFGSNAISDGRMVRMAATLGFRRRGGASQRAESRRFIRTPDGAFVGLASSSVCAKTGLQTIVVATIACREDLRAWFTLHHICQDLSGWHNSRGARKRIRCAVIRNLCPTLTGLVNLSWTWAPFLMVN